MNWLRNKKKLVDERIINAQNKIYREIYQVVMLICVVSIVVKYYMYGIDLGLVSTELAILILSSVYYIVRSASLGIFSDEIEVHDRGSKISMSSKKVYLVLGLGLVLAVFFGVRSAYLYGDGYLNSIYYFVIVFFASLMIYLPFFLFIILGPYLTAKRVSEKVTEKDLDLP